MAELMEIEPENLLGRNLKVYEVDTITRYLKGLKVNYQILNQPRTKRTYRVNSLGESASRCTFDHDDGKITVERYFSAYKNCPLRYPNLPVLKVGSREKQISLPAEVCTLLFFFFFFFFSITLHYKYSRIWRTKPIDQTFIVVLDCGWSKCY